MGKVTWLGFRDKVRKEDQCYSIIMGRNVRKVDQEKVEPKKKQKPKR